MCVVAPIDPITQEAEPADRTGQLDAEAAEADPGPPFRSAPPWDILP